MNAKKIDKIAISTLYVIAGIIVTILAALILYILVRGIPHISWSFLTSRSSSYKAGGGIGVQLYNSFFLLVITLIISVPLSMGAGIFLSEYAKKGRLTNFVRTCIEILSSLPSVVVGLFGYLIFVVQFQYGFSILSGALALTVFNLPQMTRTVEDSLRTVHHTQREAGLALGLSRWETILHVVVPEALPGIVTGIVLASGRIFGEAAALIYTAGQSAPALNWSDWNPLSISSPISIFRQAETLAVHIWKVNSEGTTPDATAVSAGSAAVLLIFILIFNFGARRLGAYLHKELALETKDLHVYYGQKEAIKGIDMQFEKNKITALIGPSGCGKSTFLRSLNRMNDTIDIAKVTGQILYQGVDVNASNINVYEMRKHIGMVFQRPNPFAKSIYRNITFAHERKGVRDKQTLDEIVETSLKQAGLWDQVKDDLHKSAFTLSGGQQQRLCIARAIAVKPQILLMDEPAASLDPVATMQLEETMFELKEDYSIIIVTHNMQQAARASDYTAFFYLGDLIEYDETKKIFQDAALQSTNDYVSGRFG